MSTLCTALAFGCEMGVVTTPELGPPDVAADVDTTPVPQVPIAPGESTDGSVPDVIADAGKFFDDNVQPLLGKCTGCHAVGGLNIPGATKFLGESPTNYREDLLSEPKIVQADPEKSELLLKSDDRRHLGPPFTDQEQDLIRQWIALEFGS